MRRRGGAREEAEARVGAVCAEGGLVERGDGGRLPRPLRRQVVCDERRAHAIGGAADGGGGRPSSSGEEGGGAVRDGDAELAVGGVGRRKGVLLRAHPRRKVERRRLGAGLGAASAVRPADADAEAERWRVGGVSEAAEGGGEAVGGHEAEEGGERAEQHHEPLVKRRPPDRLRRVRCRLVAQCPPLEKHEMRLVGLGADGSAHRGGGRVDEDVELERLRDALLPPLEPVTDAGDLLRLEVEPVVWSAASERHTRTQDELERLLDAVSHNELQLLRLHARGRPEGRAGGLCGMKQPVFFFFILFSSLN